MKKHTLKNISEALTEAEVSGTLRLNLKGEQTWPSEVFSLSQLKKLEVHSCPAVPKEIEELQELRHLTITGAQMPLPCREIFELPRLEHLSLKNNQIEYLAAEPLYPLAPLKILSLQRNKLTDLPHWLGQMRYLETLALGHNALSTLPDNFDDIETLTWLDLEANAFERLPLSVLKLKRLKHLSLDDNPFLPEEKIKITKVFPIWF